jgi:hypothetical protein
MVEFEPMERLEFESAVPAAVFAPVLRDRNKLLRDIDSRTKGHPLSRRTRSGSGQHLRREVVADCQVRGSVLEGIPDTTGSKNQPGGVLLALQQ